MMRFIKSKFWRLEVIKKFVESTQLRSFSDPSSLKTRNHSEMLMLIAILTMMSKRMGRSELWSSVTLHQRKMKEWVKVATKNSSVVWASLIWITWTQMPKGSLCRCRRCIGTTRITKITMSRWRGSSLIIRNSRSLLTHSSNYSIFRVRLAAQETQMKIMVIRMLEVEE